MNHALDQKTIVKASLQFWEQMLAMQLEPLLDLPDFALSHGHVLGAIDLTGAWNGHIECRLSRGLSEHATATMLMQPPNTVSESDMLDATKEIVNMIAGVLKSALPEPCSMSLPQAGIESSHFYLSPFSEQERTVVLVHDAGHLLVRICENPAPA